MLFSISVEDGGWNRVDRLHKFPSFLHLLHPALVTNEVTVYISPRIRIGEAELSGGDAYDGAILLMELLRLERLCPVERLPYPRKRGGPLQKGAWKVA